MKNLYFFKKLPALIVYFIAFYVILIPISIRHNVWVDNISIAAALSLILTFFLSVLTDYNKKEDESTD